MSARNRVTPLGDIVSTSLRGAWTGNRGCLHRGTEIVRFHAGDLWIVCALAFRGRRSELWRPGRFTWLFFHDEAVAFAAGHRPCGECRRDAYVAYRDAWATGLGVGVPSAVEMNRQLHGERIVRGTHRRRLHRHAWHALPDGAFVLVGGRPKLVAGDMVIGWTTAGYGPTEARPVRGDADVITPPSTLAVLRAGYPVQIDVASARARAWRRAECVHPRLGLRRLDQGPADEPQPRDARTSGPSGRWVEGKRAEHPAADELRWGNRSLSQCGRAGRRDEEPTG